MNRDENEGLKNIWVLFVIENVERNICDQKLIEFALYKEFGIFSMRLSFS